MLLFLGCTDRLTTCQQDAVEYNAGDRTWAGSIPGDDGLDEITVQLVLPWAEAPSRDQGDAPAVFVQGAWAPDVVPVEEGRGRLVTPFYPGIN